MLHLADMGATDGALSVVIDADGRVVVTVFSEAMVDASTIVVQFDDNGDLDSSFSGDGKLALDIPGSDWGLARLPSVACRPPVETSAGHVVERARLRHFRRR